MNLSACLLEISGLRRRMEERCLNSK